MVVAALSMQMEKVQPERDTELSAQALMIIMEPGSGVSVGAGAGVGGSVIGSFQVSFTLAGLELLMLAKLGAFPLEMEISPRIAS